MTWDEAFRRCSELLRPVVAEHGIEAVTAYVGNPLAHDFSLGRYVGILIGMSGIPMIYSPGTVDQWPKNVSSHLMYGGMWKIPVPDIQRTDLLVVMGANPHASQGSLLACPDVMGEIDAIRDRGGKVIVVDPRRTGTAERADEWLPITPGTDAALLLAVAQRRSFAEDSSVLGPRGRSARRGRRDRAAGRGVDPRAGRARSPASPRTRIRRARPRSSPEPNARWSTAASGCATRSSARWRAGSSTSSTS